MATVKKGVLTQGTKVYIKSGDELFPMDCIKAIQLGDDSPTEIDTTCLDEMVSKTTRYGLTTHGEGSLSINTDPTNLSHIKLLQLAAARAEVEVVVAWSDGVAIPTVATKVLTLPVGRTFTTFTANLIEKSPTFEADSLVNHTIGMKRQTPAVTQYKTTI